MERRPLLPVAVAFWLGSGVAFALLGLRAIRMERETALADALRAADAAVESAALHVPTDVARALATAPSERFDDPAAEEHAALDPTPAIADDDRLLLDQAEFLERTGAPAEAEALLRRLAGRAPPDLPSSIARLRAGALARLRGDEGAEPLLRAAAAANPAFHDGSGVPIALAACRLLVPSDVAAGREETVLRLLDAARDGGLTPTRGGVRAPELLAAAITDLVLARTLAPGPLRERLGRAKVRLATARTLDDAMDPRGVAIAANRVAVRRAGPSASIVATWLDRVRDEVAGRTGLPLVLSDGPIGGDGPSRRAPAPFERLHVGLPTWRALAPSGVGTTSLALGGGLYLLGGLAAILWVRRTRAAHRMQADFVAAVSHELKTPIAGIQALAELLADGRVPDAARARHYAERIRAEAARLGAGVRDVLDAARIERDPTTLVRPRPLEPSRLVEELATTLRPVYEGRGFVFRVTAAPAPRPVAVDADAFAHVLENLLDNAAKFSGDVRELDLDARPAPGGYLVTVADRGPGVPPEERATIFERFRRGEHARREALPGVGLGLHVARRLVAAHGGTIEVRARAGGGAEFVILWPEGRS